MKNYVVLTLLFISNFLNAQIRYGIYEDNQAIVAILPDGTAYTSCKSCLQNDTTFTTWTKTSESSIQLKSNTEAWVFKEDRVERVGSPRKSVILKEEYYESGVKKLAGSWERYDGYKYRKSGKWIGYHPNGQIMSIQTFKEGELSGDCLEFDSAGTLVLTCQYESGKLEGLKQTYYSNGNNKSKEHYTAGEKDGEAEYYNTNGYPNLIGNWKNGLKTGTWTAIAPNKINRVELVYKKGVLINEEDVSLKVTWVTIAPGEDILEKIKESQGK